MSNKKETNTSNNPLMTEAIFTLEFDLGALTVEQYKEALDFYLEKAYKEHEEVCALSELTREDIFEKYHASQYLGAVNKILDIMISVSGDDALVALDTEYTDRLVAFHTETGLDKRKYDLLVKFSKGHAFTQCREVDQSVVLDVLDSMNESGIGLSEAGKAELTRLGQELSKATQEFSQNLANYKKTLGFEVSEEKLKGLPEWAVTQASALGKERGVSFWLNQSSGLYDVVMKYADDRELRKRVYEDNKKLGVAKGFSNEVVIGKIFDGKRAIAKLLGHRSYAEMALKKNMASSSGEVLSFLDKVNGGALAVAKEERRELVEYAKGLGIDKYRAWDAGYVVEKYRQDRLAFSQEEVRAHLSVDKVVANTLSWVGRLLDVEIRRVEGVKGWAPGVEFYELWNGGEKAASFYLDLYMRDGKRGGAWVNGVQTRSLEASGLKLPVGLLVCNFTREVSGDSKMGLDDVHTLFHELGHLMHFCLTKVDEEYYAGFNNVQWDTVEFPSQLFENFVYDYGVLNELSGGGFPLELHEGVMRDKRFLAATGLVRYAEMAQMDMELYAQPVEGEVERPAEVEARMKEKWRLSETVSKVQMMPKFSHIFAGGYSAQYYAYQWAEVMSLHGFSEFRKVLGDEAGLKALAGKYKEEVLSQGGWRDMRENFEAWLGESPNESHLLAELGLGEVAVATEKRTCRRVR